MTPRQQCLPYTAGLMSIWSHRDCGSIHSVCIGLSQWGPSTEREKWMWTPISSQEAMCKGNPMAKEKLVYSNEVSLVYYAHFRTRQGCRSMLRSSWPIQNKLNGILINFSSRFALFGYFLSFAWFLWLLFLCRFCLCVCICLYRFDVHLFKKGKKKHKVEWKEKWGGTGRN